MCTRACWDKSPGLRNEAIRLISSIKPRAQKALTGSAQVKACSPTENSWLKKKKKEKKRTPFSWFESKASQTKVHAEREPRPFTQHSFLIWSSLDLGESAHQGTCSYRAKAVSRHDSERLLPHSGLWTLPGHLVSVTVCCSCPPPHPFFPLLWQQDPEQSPSLPR